MRSSAATSRRFYTDDDRRDGVPEAGLATALDTGRWRNEGWRVRKDGTRFWAEVVITSLHGPDGSHRGFAKVTRDLTDRKRSESALRGILDREREAANRLRELDRLKTDFIAVVAHDLRGPVGVAQSLLEIGVDDWDTDDRRTSSGSWSSGRASASTSSAASSTTCSMPFGSTPATLQISAEAVDVRALVDQVVADAAVTDPSPPDRRRRAGGGHRAR